MGPECRTIKQALNFRYSEKMKNKVSLIIQARIASIRLPGKVMMKIGGVPILHRIINSVKKCKTVDKIGVLSTDDPLDLKIQKLTKSKRIFWAGLRSNPQDNFYNFAEMLNCENIVRITADCVLVDPFMIDFMVRLHLSSKADHTSNCHPLRLVPKGFDVEVMTLKALKRANEETDDAYERFHVTPYFYNHPTKFRIVQPDENYSVDTKEDLERVRKLI